MMASSRQMEAGATELEQDGGEVLRAEGVSKTFVAEKGERIRAIDRVDLAVAHNDFVCIVGPSGCGKSTLLRIIAGLEQATSGRVVYRGSPVSKPDRNIGMVFQEYSLFPWLPVLDNVAIGLEFSGRPKKERHEVARHYLDVVEMSGFARAFPHELSGGMRQRVAIARALANDPDLLLMDEPFGSLDAHTRILLQKELLRVWEGNRKTILFVTHSVDEAIYLADRVVVMSARPCRIGETLEVGMPRPRSRANPEFGRLADRILHRLEREVMAPKRPLTATQ